MGNSKWSEFWTYPRGTLLLAFISYRSMWGCYCLGEQIQRSMFYNAITVIILRTMWKHLTIYLKGLIFSVLFTFLQKHSHHCVPCGIVYQIKVIILNSIFIQKKPLKKPFNSLNIVLNKKIVFTCHQGSSYAWRPRAARHWWVMTL